MTKIAPQPGIMEIDLYVGGQSAIAGRTDVLKLSSNENPLGPSPAAEEAIHEAAAGVNVYPTALHNDVRGVVAENLDAPPENVVLGPGADGVFDTVGRAVLEDGDGVLTPEPGFSYYGRSARNQGGQERSYPLRTHEGFEYDADRIRLEEYSGTTPIFGTSSDGVYEFQGAYYEVTTTELGE